MTGYRIDPNRRKEPSPSQPPARVSQAQRAPLKRVSKKRAALMAKVGPERRELKERVGQCMKCRQPLLPEALDCHEVANGAAREKCMQEPLLVLVLCRGCHSVVQGWQPARQIALHFRWLIEAGCKRYCELMGYAETAVEPADVVTFLMHTKPEMKPSRKRGKSGNTTSSLG